MTDPLSTIRQALTCPVVGFDINPALAACDALEAELLTPEEARWWVNLYWSMIEGGRLSPNAEIEAKVAKLERRAAE